MRYLSWLVFLTALAVTGCTSSDQDFFSLDGDFSAQFSGTEDGQDFDEAGMLTLSTTSDGFVTGTWSMNNGSDGTFSGMIDGNNLDFDLTQSSPCAVTFVGTGTVESSFSFSGTYQGIGCVGDLSASLAANAN